MRPRSTFDADELKAALLRDGKASLLRARVWLGPWEFDCWCLRNDDVSTWRAWTAGGSPVDLDAQPELRAHLSGECRPGDRSEWVVFECRLATSGDDELQLLPIMGWSVPGELEPEKRTTRQARRAARKARRQR